MDGGGVDHKRNGQKRKAHGAAEGLEDGNAARQKGLEAEGVSRGTSRSEKTPALLTGRGGAGTSGGLAPITLLSNWERPSLGKPGGTRKIGRRHVPFLNRAGKTNGGVENSSWKREAKTPRFIRSAAV